MGITHVEGVVRGPMGKQATVRFLVDSGATYTLLPHDIWKALDLVPKRIVSFTLADGTSIEREVSECHLTLPEGEGHTPVILGQPGDQARLARGGHAGNPRAHSSSLQAHAGTDAHAPGLSKRKIV